MEVVLKYFDGFTEKQKEQLAALQEVYTFWNNQINVISRKDTDALYEKHVLHSLAIVPVCEFLPGMNIIDIGTGGGFPGIPLAIFYPETEFLLVDSIGKKIKVVHEVAKAIGLKNITTLNARAETAKQNNFDFAVSRAVAPLSELWKWAKPLIRKGKNTDLANGLICLKGGDLSLEISQSDTRPSLWDIEDFFEEEHFKEKFVVWVGKK